jgi:hypothetical protein
VAGAIGDEELVIGVALELRSLMVFTNVLDREWMEAELLAQPVEVAFVRIDDVDPPQATVGVLLERQM